MVAVLCVCIGILIACALVLVAFAAWNEWRWWLEDRRRQ